MTKVDFPYLDKQFAEIDVIIDGIKSVVARGDFTLGKEVDELERLLERKLGVRHAIGVNCGTDALKLALKAVGVEPGDEVITSANTFIATIGAINEIGATPVFVDCNNIFCTDASKVEAAITERTKAIVPVHLSGAVSDVDAIMRIATKRGLHVVEDACQAFMSELNGRKAGTIGHAGAFSLHPMKFLNIWGDGGIVVTNDDALAARLRLLRNHGLESRDSVVILGYNSRLDTIQAVVAKHVLATSSRIIDVRVMNAGLYDRAFRSINQLTVPPRDPAILHTYVTYQVLAGIAINSSIIVERLASIAASTIRCRSTATKRWSNSDTRRATFPLPTIRPTIASHFRSISMWPPARSNTPSTSSGISIGAHQAARHESSLRQPRGSIC